jgi:tRNA modification GTPase
MSDTIAAISTAFGEAAISVLRVSGPDAMAVAGKVFSGHAPVCDLSPRTAHFGHIIDSTGATVDSVLLTLFRAPASYTGEDLVEISCHGGILVTRRILELLLSHGARPAQPGEFTQRAFLNGKMDLTQAEAVMDLIHAQSDLALKAATRRNSSAPNRCAPFLPICGRSTTISSSTPPRPSPSPTPRSSPPKSTSP